MDRKADTRRKIQLGGLIVKAGLDKMYPMEMHVVYGMLLECRKAQEAEPKIKRRWAEMGKSLLEVQG